MKKTIRLNESDLHRMIKESVKVVLNELNWKTFQNAADKSYQRGYDEDFDDIEEFEKDMLRTGRFAQAARDAFKRQHPTARGRFRHGEDAMGYPSPLATYYPGYSRRKHVFTNNGGLDDYTHESGFAGTPLRTTPSERDVMNYANGITKYIKGKGWVDDLDDEQQKGKN